MKSIPKQMLRAVERLSKAVNGEEEVSVQYHLDLPRGKSLAEANFIVRVGDLSASDSIWEMEPCLDAAVLHALGKCKTRKTAREREVAELQAQAENLGLEVRPKGGAR